MNLKTVCTLMLVAVVLLACAPSETKEPTLAPATQPAAVSADAADTDATVLQFAVSSMNQTRYENLIEAFEAENPGVIITLVPIEQTIGMRWGFGAWPEDAFLLLAAAADVIDAAATRTAVQQGALLDLSTFFQSDPNLNIDAFYPNMIESAQWQGGIWSVPVEASYSLINYDKSLFDAAGIAYPEPGWRWDDFLAAAQQLTLRDGDAVTQWGFSESPFDPATLVQARTGLLFDAEMSPTAAKLDTPAVVGAVTWYCDLYTTHGVAPYGQSVQSGIAVAARSGSGEQAPNRQRLNESASSAMWTGFQFRMNVQRRPDSQQTAQGVAPFPVDQAGDHSTPVTVSGLSISAGTSKADLAWKWVSFLAQQSGRTRAFGPNMSTMRLPALPQVAAAAGYWDDLDEETSAAMTYAIEHAYVDTYDGAGNDALEEAVVAIIESGRAAEAALADAQTAATLAIEEAAAAAPTPVTNLVVSDTYQKAVDAGAVVIEFGTSSGQGRRFAQQSYTNLIEEFQAEHPDIIVEIKSPQNFRGQMDLADMAAEYDCFLASPSLNEESLGAILSMEPFVASDPELSKTDFYDALLKQFTHQGQLWGIPGTATVRVINYNKDLFDAADVAYPQATWSTSDFVAAAVALTQGEGETAQYGYVTTSSEIDELIGIMDRLGVGILNEAEDPPRLVVDSSEAIKAMRWYTGLTTQYHVTPELDDEANDDRWDPMRDISLISEGHVAMWMDTGTWFWGGMSGQQDDTEMNIGTVPLPSGPKSDQGSGFQTVDGYFISNQTESREACWAWITFLTEHTVVNSGLPARRSTSKSDAYRQAVGDGVADAYIASVSSGSAASFYQRVSDQGSWLQFATRFLSDAHGSIVEDGVTVEVAMAEAQETLDAYRDCVITNDAFLDMTALRDCYNEASR